MIKIELGNICKPKSRALIIPANSAANMLRGRQSLIIKDGLGGISKEAKEFVESNKVDLGSCFVTGPGRLNKRGVEKIYHAVIKRLQSDFTSIHIVRNAIKKSLRQVEIDGFKSVAICGIGIERGELDPISVAKVTFEELKNFKNKMEVKVIDENKEFIKEMIRLEKE